MKRYEVTIDGRLIGLFKSQEAVQTLCVHRDSTVEVREVEPCNCEHIVHDNEGDAHAPYEVAAGDARAQHVGAICDECVDHMRDWLV